MFGNFFNKAVQGSYASSVPEIYPFRLACDLFIKFDITATYRKILIDVLERTHGIPDEQQKHFWDNVVGSESPDGIISLLVDGMYNQGEVCIFYDKSINFVRKATPDEQQRIKTDYAKSGKSPIGAYISFKNFNVTSILKIYSEAEYGILRGLHKGINITRATQLKISNLRASVAVVDSEIAIAQAKAIAEALKKGDDVLIDKEDTIESATFDIGPVEKSIEFTNMKKAFYLGLPYSYIAGIQTGGIGSTGEGDNRAVERGLKMFYESIIAPVTFALFGIKTVFRSADFRQISNALETAKTFELVSDTLLSRAAKDSIIAQMFDLDPELEKKNKEKEAAARGSDTTLNGAQVTAMSQFLAQLASGQLAPDTAINALMVSFGMSEEDAEKIVNPMTTFKPKVVK